MVQVETLYIVEHNLREALAKLAEEDAASGASVPDSIERYAGQVAKLVTRCATCFDVQMLDHIGARALISAVSDILQKDKNEGLLHSYTVMANPAYISNMQGIQGVVLFQWHDAPDSSGLEFWLKENGMLSISTINL